ncbi:MAG: CHC2 zinc finger domain-containing protein, partial [Sideroxydans sp.]
MIPKSFIQDLLNRLDIVDVIERYVPLKKAGTNFVACCPFHTEKSPSFTVSQSKQFYHCFGCGAHGTAIGFVMEHTGMGFVEAIEDLAKGIGLAVPQEASNIPQIKVAPDLYDLMQSATRYYREQLKVTPRAIEYLKKRGFYYLSLSDFIREELAEQNEEITRESMIAKGNDLRARFGQGILAQRAVQKMEKDRNYIVDSIRNPGEVKELKKLKNFVLVHVHAPPEIRFERMKARKRESDPQTFEAFKIIEEAEMKKEG